MENRFSTKRVFKIFRFLSLSIHKLIVSLEGFPKLDSNQMDDLPLKKLAHRYKKIYIENLALPLELTREEYWSIFNQGFSYEDYIERLQTLVDKFNMKRGRE